MIEIWKDIKGYEGLYQVSNIGNVKSLNRVLKRIDNKKCSIREKILKPNLEKKGYQSVKLCYLKNSKMFKVHRLVAEAFIPNIENKPQINHKNLNKQDNKITNLEWCTAKENIIHAAKRGLLSRKPTKKQIEIFTKMAKNNVINVCQYDLNGNFIKRWNSIRDVERALKINNANITSVCKNKRKNAGGFIWKYSNDFRTKND